MTEHRTAPRHRVLKGGSIRFNGTVVISCTVRNLSNAGAALDVSPVGIPPAFTLMIDGEQAGRPCRVIWRKEKRIGVAFD